MRIPGPRLWIDFAKTLSHEFHDDDVLNGGAVLAFFFLLAVFPAAIFVLSLLPSLSIPHLQQAILDLLHQILPQQSASLFEGTIQSVTSGKGKGLLTFGLVFALWSGSTGVFALSEQLNAICDVTEERPFWKARGIAILMTVFLGSLQKTDHIVR
jgi:membrane protein